MIADLVIQQTPHHESFLGLTFSSSVSLGVILLSIITILAAGFAVWRTQSVAALRQANTDLRDDRDDWKARYEDQVTENHRLEAHLAQLVAKSAEQDVAIARLEERTDTSSLAKEVVVSAFRDEMRAAVVRLEELDTAKLGLLKQQGEMITTLISRDPSLRTRSDDPIDGGVT